MAWDTATGYAEFYYTGAFLRVRSGVRNWFQRWPRPLSLYETVYNLGNIYMNIF